MSDEFSTIARQRDAWRRAAQQAEVALRRCLEDSKDLLKTPDCDFDWVHENIALATAALAQLDALEGDPAVSFRREAEASLLAREARPSDPTPSAAHP